MTLLLHQMSMESELDITKDNIKYNVWRLLFILRKSRKQTDFDNRIILLFYYITSRIFLHFCFMGHYIKKQVSI